jgi:hypothetical protein
MTSHVWYFAVPVTGDDFSMFKEGQNVKMNFGIYSLGDIPATVYSINGDSDAGVVVMKSNYILPKLISLRHSDVKISFGKKTGLRIPTSAIRFLDGVEGVYVKTGSEIVFKKINVIYETDSFKISSVSNTDDSYLSLYDEIIVKGRDIYDGKPVKQR